MFKSTAAVMVAAIMAAALTILSAPTAQVDATPVAQPVAEAMTACAKRSWPYLRTASAPNLAINASAWSVPRSPRPLRLNPSPAAR